jgi:polynucleotide 5'-hydroxyl-kinase GRC3/NOL9
MDRDPHQAPLHRAALQRLVDRGGRVLIVGAPDTGKTTAAMALARLAAETGRPAAIVDGDVGQGALALPGTVGLLVAGTDGQPALAEARFVGDVSPLGAPAATVAALAGLARRAEELGVALTVIDTSGAVSGAAARDLKIAKLDALRPQSVLAMERAEELRWLVRTLPPDTPVERLPPWPGVRTRPVEYRRQRRQARFFRALEGAEEHLFPLEQVVATGTWFGSSPALPAAELAEMARVLRCRVLYGERRGAANLLTATRPPVAPPLGVRVTALDEIRGLLTGLLGPEGCLAGIGLLVGIDPQRASLRILTSCAGPGAIRRVAIGRLRLSPDGVELDRAGRRR